MIITLLNADFISSCYSVISKKVAELSTKGLENFSRNVNKQ